MVAPVQPSPGDIAYLRAHPEVADKFNAKFGPNSANRFMRPTMGSASPNPEGVTGDIVRSGAEAGTNMMGALAGQAAGAAKLAAMQGILPSVALRSAGELYGDVATDVIGGLGLEDVASYEPQTAAGKAVHYAVPYLPMLAGGLMANRPYVGLGAFAAGAGSEAGIVEGLGQPREVGALAGGLASAVAGSPMLFRRPDARLAEEALRGVPEQSIADAIALQRSSVEEGVPLMAPEALNEPGVIALADAAATYPGAAAPFHAVARQREMLARGAIEDKLGTVGQTDVSPGAATTEMVGASEKIIGGATQARTQAARQAGYSNLPGEAVSPDGITALAAKVDATIAQTGGMSGLKPLLQKFRSQLFEADGTPITNAAYLESIFKQLREGLNRRTSGALISPDDAISAEDAGKVGPLIDELQEILKTAPSYEPGRATFEDISKTVVDPLKERLEPVIGASNWKQLRTIMLSPDSLTAKELTPVLQTIEQKSPSAIPNIARVIFERAYDIAFRQRKGKTPPTSPAAFVDYLRNSGIQKAKFEEVVRSVARSQGQNPNLVLSGWNKLLDVLQRTAVMPDVGSRTNPRGVIQQKAGETLLTEAVNLMQPLAFIERITGSRNMKRLGHILADQNGVQGLIDLSQTKPNTARAAYIVNALLQTARVIENPGTEQ